MFVCRLVDWLVCWFVVVVLLFVALITIRIIIIIIITVTNNPSPSNLLPWFPLVLFISDSVMFAHPCSAWCFFRELSSLEEDPCDDDDPEDEDYGDDFEEHTRACSTKLSSLFAFCKDVRMFRSICAFEDLFIA